MRRYLIEVDLPNDLSVLPASKLQLMVTNAETQRNGTYFCAPRRVEDITPPRADPAQLPLVHVTHCSEPDTVRQAFPVDPRADWFPEYTRTGKPFITDNTRNIR